MDFKNSILSTCYFKGITLELKTHRLKVRKWKKIFHVNGNDKKEGVTILISDKIAFKKKAVTRDNEGCYIMIKDTSDNQYKRRRQKLLTYMHQILGAPKYIKQIQTDIKRETDNTAIQ